MSSIGIGGIVTSDPHTPWVSLSDFAKILDDCTNELGVNYIDTAPAYELAEETIGRWLHF